MYVWSAISITLYTILDKPVSVVYKLCDATRELPSELELWDFIPNSRLVPEDSLDAAFVNYMRALAAAGA